MVHGVAKSQTWLKRLSTAHRFRKMSPLHANPTEARWPEEGKEQEEQKAAELRPCWDSTGSGPPAALSTSEMLWKSFSSDTAHGHYLASNPVKYPSCIAPFTCVFESVIKEMWQEQGSKTWSLHFFSWKALWARPVSQWLNHVWRFVTLWIVALQVPLSIGFLGKKLEWVAISSSRGSSWPRDQPCISCVSCIGRQILYHLCHLGSPFLNETAWKEIPKLSKPFSFSKKIPQKSVQQNKPKHKYLQVLLFCITSALW